MKGFDTMNTKEKLLNEMFSEFVDIIDGDNHRKNAYYIEWISEYEFSISDNISGRIFVIYLNKDEDKFVIYISANWTHRGIQKEYKTKKGVINYVKKQII